MLLSAKKRKSSSLFNKSKTSINLTLALFVINFFIFSAHQDSKFFKSIKSSLNLTSYSLSFFLDNLTYGIDSVHQYFLSKKTLIQKNHELQNKLYFLNNQILLQENLILDNQELQNKLEIKEKYFDHSIIGWFGYGSKSWNGTQRYGICTIPSNWNFTIWNLHGPS